MHCAYSCIYDLTRPFPELILVDQFTRNDGYDRAILNVSHTLQMLVVRCTGMAQNIRKCDICQDSNLFMGPKSACGDL